MYQPTDPNRSAYDERRPPMPSNAPYSQAPSNLQSNQSGTYNNPYQAAGVAPMSTGGPMMGGQPPSNKVGMNDAFPSHMNPNQVSANPTADLINQSSPEDRRLMMSLAQGYFLNRYVPVLVGAAGTLFSCNRYLKRAHKGIEYCGVMVSVHFGMNIVYKPIYMREKLMTTPSNSPLIQWMRKQYGLQPTINLENSMMSDAYGSSDFSTPSSGWDAPQPDWNAPMARNMPATQQNWNSPASLPSSNTYTLPPEYRPGETGSGFDSAAGYQEPNETRMDNFDRPVAQKPGLTYDELRARNRGSTF